MTELPGLSYEELAARVRTPHPPLNEGGVLRAVRSIPLPTPETLPTPDEVGAMVHAAVNDEAFNNPTHIVEAVDAAEAPSEPVAAPEPEAPAPWPHLVIEYAGEPLEVRKPDAQALVAFSLCSGEGIGQDVQMAVFGSFIRNHLSPASFLAMVNRMVNPDDDGVSIETLIRTLAELANED